MSYGRPPPDVEGMTSLKVDNLTYRTSPETLRRVFEKYGRVGDVYIPRDRYTKESRGFAFVRFLDKRDAEDAMDAMDGALLDGRELRVQMARYGRPPDSMYSRRGAPQRRYGGQSPPPSSKPKPLQEQKPFPVQEPPPLQPLQVPLLLQIQVKVQVQVEVQIQVQNPQAEQVKVSFQVQIPLQVQVKKSNPAIQQGVQVQVQVQIQE
ncbi:Serine/arginine-rich splicing factor 2 [Collichthys lucidus]|uniref:Serine/arginine-rich splicing factor 2 n=1 Tax=Collichthys lucidus TaxID=240159 RepID=A0A4U5VRF1_COLLU|nr:Serine/arginine-rich splicing factor 2 [Collichthys lucidus]